MRVVSITREEFDHMLFPAWANAQNAGDPELVIRVTRKLKSISSEKELTPGQKQLREAGKLVFADRYLDADFTVLHLEEDEWKCLRDMFDRTLKNFSTLAMEYAYDLAKKLKNAQEEAQEAKGE